jgi:protein ImuB
VRTPPLVRRIYARPLPFSPGRHREAEAELIRHIDEGTVRETLGPYIVSGGWWSREVQREYYFVRTSNGRALWMFYDRRRMGWFIHGEVE